MKVKINKVILIGCLALLSNTVFAQLVNIKLLYDTSNNTLVTKTKVFILQDGEIKNKKLQSTYQIKPNVIFSLSFSNPEIFIKDIKKILITKDSTIVLDGEKLNEVIVKSKRALVSQNQDGYSYYPQRDSALLKKPIAFALQRLPNIVLINNELTFKETEKIKFLINGKERKGLGSNWNSILQNIQAEKILRVDLNNDPSVRVKQEGYSVVIDILTIDDNLYGSSGGLNLNFDSRQNLNPTANFTFLNKKSDISIRVSQRSDKQNNERTFETKENVTNNLKFLDSTKVELKSSALNLSLDYGLRIDSAKDFNFSFGYSNIYRNNNNINLTNFPQPRFDNLLNTNNNNFTFSLGFSTNKRKGVFSSIALLASLSKESVKNDIGYLNKIYSDSVENLNISTPRQLLFKYNNLNTKNAKKRYEFGFQTYFKSINSDFNQTIRLLNGIRSNTISKSDSLLQNQYSIKPYYSFLRSYNKNATLRVDLFSEIFITKNNKENTNIFFLPETKFRFSRPLTKITNLTLSSNFSFRKPNIDFLNPFRVSDNPLFSRIGNINIRPEKNINFTIEFSKRKKIITSHRLYISKSFGLINQFNILTNNTYLGQTNNSSNSTYMAYYFRVQGAIKSRLFYSLSPSIGYHTLKNKLFMSSFNGVIWSINSNLNYSTKKVGDFGFSSFINSRQNNAQGYNFGTVLYNLSYSKFIYKNKISFGSSVDNFLSKNRIANSLVNSGNTTNTITSIIPNRLFNISLSYNFNNIKFAKFAKKVSVDLNDQVDRVK